jgi:FAD/FMN-containing dehydrogenase/Fe-S oxidoreductase
MVRRPGAFARWDERRFCGIGMPMSNESPNWRELRLDGDLLIDEASRALYSTDASEFQEMPLAVALPAHEEDIRRLILFARRNRIGLIPRAAGTSLAGQVVGNGIVVDAGRHLNRIVAIDARARRARAQPGVVRNDLNAALEPHGLFFAPETSTSDRAMIGGMVGNNSCGANSIVYGSTRDHLVSARGFLGDGSEVVFGPLTDDDFFARCAGADSSETRIYRYLRDRLSDPDCRRAIRDGFPHAAVTRRNTGYALDALMDARVFDPASEKGFNLCRLIAGSEGTLFFGVEFELNLEPLPPPPSLLCAHFRSIDEALRAAAEAMRFRPAACEMIDRHILAATAGHPELAAHRRFLRGEPEAVLAVEFRAADPHAREARCRALADRLCAAGLGYAFPVLRGDEIEQFWSLRRAGQSLLYLAPGDARPAEVVEDTAVAVEDLANYIADFDREIRRRHGIDCVYYGHAGAGEIHIRPLLNLNTADGRRLFRAIAEETAALVKRYRGALSGEHGDGRLRGEFLRFMVGEACYTWMREIKDLFDPDGVLNPGKIIDAPPMDRALRHAPQRPAPRYETYFDFSRDRGILRAIERCNGAGACRKTHLSGGTMCPSYMATRDEKDSTRARANLLRRYLADPPDPSRPFARDELREVLDLCLSCKGCKAECPSSVDLARLKAEFLQHYYDARGAPLSARLAAHFADIARLGACAPAAWNAFLRRPFAQRIARRALKFDPRRPLPPLPDARDAARLLSRRGHRPARDRTVYFFCDEFTRFQDAETGLAAVELLERLGYTVVIPRHVESGRAAISKGLLRRARRIAARNVELLAPLASDDRPLVGVEPAALLAFRDEYPDLLRGERQRAAQRLASHTLLIEEFLAREADAGRLDGRLFAPVRRTVHAHGHCHQKALGAMSPALRVLRDLGGYDVRVIPSGCCGMAGSFGFELGHYELSMAIGELVLFPYVRAVDAADAIAATGISCRQQIRDGTGREALHPAALLRAALRAAP